MRPRRASAITACLLVLSSAFACNALSGVDDLGAADGIGTRSDGGAPVDARIHDLGDTGGGDPVTPLDAGGDAPTTASLCDRLTLVLPFDGTSKSTEGTGPTGGDHGGFVAGKFGQAYAFTDSAAELDYDAKSGGLVSATEGTISMWIDSSNWEMPCGDEHDFFGVDDGVYMDCEPDGVLGVFVDLSDTYFVGSTLSPAAGKGAWVAGYNHLVATWSTTPPSFRITLNGTVTASTSSTWTAPHPVARQLYLGSNDFSPNASIDDVAVWTRALSVAEIQSVYAAGKPMADVCGLK